VSYHRGCICIVSKQRQERSNRYFTSDMLIRVILRFSVPNSSSRKHYQEYVFSVTQRWKLVMCDSQIFVDV